MQLIKDYISSNDSDVALTWISCGLFFNIIKEYYENYAKTKKQILAKH